MMNAECGMMNVKRQPAPYSSFRIQHSSLPEDSVPERRAAGNLFEGVGEFAVGLGFEGDVGHRDDAAQVPIAVDDGEAAHLLVAHLAYGLDDAVVGPHGVQLRRHHLLRAQLPRVRPFGDGADDDVAVCDESDELAVCDGARGDAMHFRDGVGRGLARLDDGDDARVLVPHHARDLFDGGRARGDRHVARHDVAAAQVRARRAAASSVPTALVRLFKVAPFGTPARVVFVAVVFAAPLYRVVVVAARSEATARARTLSLVVLVPARRPELRPLFAPARPARVKVFVPIAAPSRHCTLPKTLPPDVAQKARRAFKASRDRAPSHAPSRRPRIFTPRKLEAIILTSDEIASKSKDEG